MATQMLKRGFHWFRERGLVGSAQSAMGIVEDLLFDRLYGLETSENVYDLDIDDAAKPHCQTYQPTRIRHFRKLMHSLKLPTRHVFVDVGCGKGRMLVAAAQMGFRRVVGIEISPRLSETASRNVDVFKGRSRSSAQFEIICSNISDAALRHDESVFYLFWPFDRPTTVMFLEKLRASLRTAPRELWIIINNPKYPELFAESSDFRHHSRFCYGGSTFDIFHHQP